jgi:hypothetical protein
METLVTSAQRKGNDMAREITIRRSNEGDAAVLAQLAALDGRTEPRGEALIAFVDGEAWAALPLAAGSAIADPFRPAAELVELLQARRSQIQASSSADRHARRNGHGRLRRLPGAVARASGLAAIR